MVEIRVVVVLLVVAKFKKTHYICDFEVCHINLLALSNIASLPGPLHLSALQK